ncbi:hypothetical protein [Rhizobium alvei]|uniref:Gamma-glutamyl kinase n=1 Tax=Rhizobium alvei TaxID=1132659 RepID=A0ABT8YGA5_9HYPH|nr:hypothetical protein [Rhizobium alvei]MDO6962701.1 hypothetical protein [Rhizobium alvei]
MLYFHKQKLVILTQPKTGTTALHEAIASEASIAFNTPPHMKHMTYAKFMRMLSEWISQGDHFPRKKYTFVSVMREPVEWFGSWYRYNRRDSLASENSNGNARYTGNISFNEYLEALLLPKDEAPAYAKLGGPCSIALDKSGAIGVDRLFRYSDLDQMVDFVAEKLGRSITLEKANVSEKMALEAEEATLARIKEKFAFEFSVYEGLKPDGTVGKEIKALRSEGKQGR